MRKRWLINLGLLATALLLSLTVFLQPGRAPDSQSSHPTLTQRRASEVNRIGIQRREAEDIELRKDPQGVWRMTRPLRLPANRFRLRNILEVLETGSFSRFPVDGHNLADFGLDDPRAILFLDDLQLDYGILEPLSQHRYLRLGDTIHLISDLQYPLLTGKAVNLVSLYPFGEKPELLAIKTPGYHLRQTKTGWRPVGEITELLASADSLQKLVDEWRHLQATRVSRVSEQPVDKAPEIRLTLQGQAAPLRFGEEITEMEWRLRRPEIGVVYHFPLAYRQKVYLD